MEFKVYLQQSSFIHTEFTLHSYSAQLILWMVNNRNWRAAYSWVGEHWFEFATDGFYHHGWWATAPQRRSLVMIVTTNNDDQPMVKPLSQFLPIFKNIMTFLHCWWESGLMYSNFFGEVFTSELQALLFPHYLSPFGPHGRPCILENISRVWNCHYVTFWLSS